MGGPLDALECQTGGAGERGTSSGVTGEEGAWPLFSFSWTEKLELARAVPAGLQLKLRSLWTSRPDQTKRVGWAVVSCALGS